MTILSIITITNGDLAPLERTVSSFHSNESVEWIVISSMDSFPTDLRKPDLFIGNESNGIFSALNLGLEKSKGELIVFMHAGDEFYAPDTISKVIESWFAQRWKWAVGNTHLQTQDGKLWRYPSAQSLQFLFGTNSFCHQAMYCETQLLRKLGGFNEAFLGADWALMLKLSQENTPVLLNFPVAIYEHGGFSTRQNYLQECSQKHLARVYYGVNLKPLCLDLLLQFVLTFMSRLIQKARG